jgi:hypothetical protein
MRRGWRRLALFGPPALVAALELGHPIVLPPIAPAVVHHLPWWLYLHIANLAVFPLLGLSAYLIVEDREGHAASWSRVAILVYVPLYAAFDALVGIGTGVQVQNASGLASESRAAADAMIDAYWESGVLFAIAAAGSIAWVIAMLAAAVARTKPSRRQAAGVVAVAGFALGGWAETNLFLPSRGHTPFSWWLVTAGIAAAIYLASGRDLVPTLLALAGSLFGAAHIPPTGPLGALCFLAAAALMEVERGREGSGAEEPRKRSRQ